MSFIILCFRIPCFSHLWRTWLTTLCFGHNHFSSNPVNIYCLSVVLSGARKYLNPALINNCCCYFAIIIYFKYFILALCNFLFILKFKRSKACILVSLSSLVFLGACWLQTQAFLQPKKCGLCHYLIILANLFRCTFLRLL